MKVRTTLIAASIAALTFVGCGSSDRNGNEDAGCTSNCSTPDSGQPDSGQPDSGQPDSGQPDSGSPDGGNTDGGGNACTFIPHSDGGVVTVSTDPATATTLTIAQLRYGENSDGGSFLPFGAHVKINGVAVAAIDYSALDGGDAHFWIVDPADPSSGFWVYKRDTDVAYEPNIGDVVNVEGAFESDPKYYVPTGRRFNLSNLFSGGTVQKQLTVTPTGSTQAVADNEVDAGCTFDARGGDRYFPQDKQAFAGTRIHVKGPLSLTDPEPVAMANIGVVTQDGGSIITGYRGFEVTGGILVATSKTFSSDGGFGDPERCDWSALAKSGKTVTFPDGISGVWSTYTMSPCIVQPDGSCARTKNVAYVPTTTSTFPASVFPDGGATPPNGNEDYVFVVYPQSCSDLPGDAGSGVTP